MSKEKSLHCKIQETIINHYKETNDGHIKASELMLVLSTMFSTCVLGAVDVAVEKAVKVKISEAMRNVNEVSDENNTSGSK